MQLLGRLLNGIREVYVFSLPFESYWNLILDSSIHSSRSQQGRDVFHKVKYDLVKSYKEQNFFWQEV